MKKYLPVLLPLSLFLASCMFKNTNAMPENTPVLSETTSSLTNSETPSPIQGETLPDAVLPANDFEMHRFDEDWKRIYQIRSSCAEFVGEGQIWSVFLELEYFDGNDWNTISTPDDFDITWSCPRVDKDGIVWFINPSTQRYAINVFSFNGIDWQLFTYPEFMTENMRSTASMAIDKTSGHIWLGLQNCEEHSCLYFFDGSQWKEEPFPFPSIYSLSANNQNLWVGGNSDTGVAHFDGNKWTYYATKDLWPDDVYGWNSQVEWINVKSDAGGSAWLILGVNDWVKISHDGQIVRYSNKFPKETTYGINIFPVGHDKVWFIWNAMELGYFDYNQNQWAFYINLPSNNLLAGPTFVPSPSGDLWLVLPNNSNGEAGLYRYCLPEE